MRPILRASSARLIVGHLDPEQAAELLASVESRATPLTFVLAEPDGLRIPAAVPAGGGLDVASEPLRWGKTVIETVANEVVASTRKDFSDTLVDGLRLAHRRLGSEGLDLIPHSSSGVGFIAATMIEDGVQLVIVPPAQVFVVHQGVAQSVPESDDVGRGIWMRDDLRAEMFAGVGGSHEPDIRVYDAAIGPGDTLVLASSSLARMLTEDDVRLAVTYEDAETAAERLKQLAIQRGVEAGIALVVEISGSFEESQPSSPLSGSIALNGIPGSPRRIDMPPIGSIFSTARDWLAEAVERIQPAGRQEPAAPADPEDDLDFDVAWPERPLPGAWRETFHPAKLACPGQGEPSVSRAGTDQAFESAAPGRELGAAKPHPGTGWRHYRSQESSTGPRRRSDPIDKIRTAARTAAEVVGGRLASVDLGTKRHLLAPLVATLAILLVLFGAVRMVKGQQARQVQQRFDSLVTAAAQLEAQARTDTDRSDALSLIKRSQALVDQAATLQPNQSRIAAIRRDLQADSERLDNVVALPEPAIAASFAKDARPSFLGMDGTAVYALDLGAQRLLQAPRGGQASVAASKGDKAGSNQLGSPKLLAMRDNVPLILDSSRNLWAYTPAKKQPLQQIGLKSADSWKDATAIAAYGPNLYVLDATSGNVFRYASRDSLFTEPPSRFFEKDNPDLLRQAVSLTIDGSIWVLTADGQILKLESAARQPFTLTGMPQPFGKPSQIATQAGFRSLYVLDAGNRVVEIAKDGHYVRQFKLNLPAAVTSIWPDETARQLYALSGNSAYQYALPG